MTLHAVADFLEQSVPQTGFEFKLRVGLSNLEAGYRLGHISRTALERRCKLLAEEFEKKSTKDRSNLWNCLVGATDALWEHDHYERKGDLSSHLDCRAVTVQSAPGVKPGMWWVGGRAVVAKAIPQAFARGECSGTVGPKETALWLTPLQGETALLCNKAKQKTLPETERDAIATRLRNKLGLYGVGAREPLLAFITKKPIRALGFENAGMKRKTPVGPTAIEARTYLRFRPWPRPAANDPYGRTYDLDAAMRRCASPPRHHGAEETVRPFMDMSEFEECIYLGEVIKSTPSSDADEFLTEIGSDRDAVSVLRRLAMVLGR